MFWDRVAGVYDIYVNVLNRRTNRALCGIVERLIEPGNDVLECACGTGMLSEVIAKRCRHLTATDLSLKMLSRAEKNCAAYGNVTFRAEDIAELQHPDGSFDKAVAGNVIHLVDDPVKALSELDRVVKPDGTLIIPTYINPLGAKYGGKQDAGEDGTSQAASGGREHIKTDASIFKRSFNAETYRQFFIDRGYPDVTITIAEGLIPCAVAVMKKKQTT